MRHANINHIVMGQRNHDKAVGQSLLSLCRRFREFLLQDSVEPLEADIAEFAGAGCYLHDREIGKAIKEGYQCFRELSLRKPMPHQILAP